MTTDTACFSSLPFSCIVLAFCQSISHWWLPWLRCRKKKKKYYLKFKLSVVEYAEENLGEAAARQWEIGKKIKLSFSVCPRRISNDPGCLVEVGRRLLGLGYQQTGMAQNDQAKQIKATVSASRDEEFADWHNQSFPPPQQLHLQKLYNYSSEGCQIIHGEKQNWFIRQSFTSLRFNWVCNESVVLTKEEKSTVISVLKNVKFMVILVWLKN